MAITLNHTIVPAHDKEASARFFAEIMGLSYDGPMGHFAPVRINDSLTLADLAVPRARHPYHSPAIALGTPATHTQLTES